jgi:hypothetical protein
MEATTIVPYRGVQYDPYPDETKSFASLPEDSPLHHLCYGIMTDKITDLVAGERRKKQKADREFFIKNINNTLLKERQRSFETPESCDVRPTFRWEDPMDRPPAHEALRSWWCAFGSNKMQMLDWFTRNKIPLVYLEELYQMQTKGPPELVKNDYIRINMCNSQHYGRVVEVNGKKIKYNPVCTKRGWDSTRPVAVQRTVAVQWTQPIHMNPTQIADVCRRRQDTLLQMGKNLDDDLEEFLLPEELLFRQNQWSLDNVSRTEFGREIQESIWKCEKVGHNDMWEEEYREKKEMIMKEIHFRQRFWLKSDVLRHLWISAFHDWFNMDYDIIGKKKRPPVPTYHRCYSNGITYDSYSIWSLIKEVIDESGQ